MTDECLLIVKSRPALCGEMIVIERRGEEKRIQYPGTLDALACYITYLPTNWTVAMMASFVQSHVVGRPVLLP